MTSTRPVRLQLSRRKDFNLQEHSRAVNGLDAVKCVRQSKWGNPFYVGGYHKIGQKCYGGFARVTALSAEYADSSFTHVTTSEQAVAMFRRYYKEFGPPNDIDQLHGKNLACFCKLGDSCHADVLLEFANK